MTDIVYSTDSEEHLINIGELSQPDWDIFTQAELQEDIEAMNNYLDQQHLDYDWDGE
tara:strand:+ start:11482 stop:11652 length:171 start_codon:yes stop_codon:yes gene_type:complete